MLKTYMCKYVSLLYAHMEEKNGKETRETLYKSISSTYEIIWVFIKKDFYKWFWLDLTCLGQKYVKAFDEKQKQKQK